MHPFGHNRNGPKIRAGSPSNTKSPGLRPCSIPTGILIHTAIWLQQIWAENWVGAVPIWGGGAGSHLTQCGQVEGLPACQLAKFHLDPSNRLATVHERQRQDRQRSDSIGQTVLQMVAQKLKFRYMERNSSKTLHYTNTRQPAKKRETRRQ